MWKARLCCLRFPRKRKIPALGFWGFFSSVISTAPAGNRNCSNSLRLACCMRWAASVSLRVATMAKLVFIEGGEKREIIDASKAHNFLGPMYFHFTTKAFLSSPQRRREDPVYVNQSFVDIFRRMCINDDHLLDERTTTSARECT